MRLGLRVSRGLDVSTSAPAISLLRSAEMTVDRQNSYDVRHVCSPLFAPEVRSCLSPREGQEGDAGAPQSLSRIDRVHGHAGLESHSGLTRRSTSAEVSFEVESDALPLLLDPSVPLDPRNVNHLLSSRTTV